MQGTIEAVKQWPDNISVKVGEIWYKTDVKDTAILGMTGQEITFTPSPWTNPKSGKTTNYMNNWQATGGQPGPADQAMNQAMNESYQQERGQGYQQAPPMGNPYPPGAVSQSGPATAQHVQHMAAQSAPAPQTKDRDAYIAAQALAKTVTHATAADALNAFQWLYRELRDWNPDAEFDDNINF